MSRRSVPMDWGDIEAAAVREARFLLKFQAKPGALPAPPPPPAVVEDTRVGLTVRIPAEITPPAKNLLEDVLLSLEANREARRQGKAAQAMSAGPRPPRRKKRRPCPAHVDDDDCDKQGFDWRQHEESARRQALQLVNMRRRQQEASNPASSGNSGGESSGGSCGSNSGASASSGSGGSGGGVLDDEVAMDVVVAPSHWVRRSERAAGSIAEVPVIHKLMRMLRSNHPDVTVLKLHHFLPPMANVMAIDAVLDALMENESCQSLYIQNFNEGFRDAQVKKLTKVLQRGHIWCINAGENYRVSLQTWWEFAEDLKSTNVTHAYLSEHVLTPELKNEIRAVIRANRKKHNRHKSADNWDVISRCTNCWWNPSNSQELRAEMAARGMTISAAAVATTESAQAPQPCSLHEGGNDSATRKNSAARKSSAARSDAATRLEDGAAIARIGG